MSPWADNLPRGGRPVGPRLHLVYLSFAYLCYLYSSPSYAKGSTGSAENHGGRHTFLMTGSSRVVNTKNGAMVGSTWKVSTPASGPPPGRGKGMIGEGEALVEQFLGVPYASKPSIRFMPPGSPVKWRGLLNATHHGSVCPQQVPNDGPHQGDVNASHAGSGSSQDLKGGPSGGSQSPESWGAGGDTGQDWERLWLYGGLEWRASRMARFEQSEDCLHLNLYSPIGRDRLSKVPTIVYVLLESYDWGSGNLYDGKIVATRSGIIAVTINIRLGIFGFLAMGDLRGNYGFLDLCAALEWIQENIAFFGGDPSQVTVLGYGYGAALANLLMMSPVASGKFKRIILIEGSMYSTLAFGTHQQSYYGLLAQISKCPNVSLKRQSSNTTQAMVQCFRELNSVDLVRASTSMVRTTNTSSPHYPFSGQFGPYVDQFVIPKLGQKDLSSLSSSIIRTNDNGRPTLHAPDVMTGLIAGCPTGVLPDWPNQGHSDPIYKSSSFGTEPKSPLPYGNGSSIGDVPRKPHNMSRSDWGKFIRSLVVDNFRFHRRQIYASVANEYTDWALPRLEGTDYALSLRQVVRDFLVTAPLIKFVKLYAGGPGAGRTYLWTIDMVGDGVEAGDDGVGKTMGRRETPGRSYGDHNENDCYFLHDQFPYILLGYPFLISHDEFKGSKKLSALGDGIKNDDRPNKIRSYYSNITLNIVANFAKYGFMNGGNSNEISSIKLQKMIGGLPDYNLMGKIRMNSAPSYDPVYQKYLSINNRISEIKTHYMAKRMALWNQLIPILHSPKSYGKDKNYKDDPKTRTQPTRATNPYDYHGDQGPSPFHNMLEMNEEGDMHYYSDGGEDDRDDGDGGIKDKPLFPPPPPAPPTLMPLEVVAKLSRLRGSESGDKPLHLTDPKIVEQLNALGWGYTGHGANNLNTGNARVGMSMIGNQHNNNDYNHNGIGGGMERNWTNQDPKIKKDMDQERGSSGLHKSTFRYVSYTSAMVITVGVGCGLLFINLVVLAAVYHQRLKQRQYRLHRKASVLTVPPTSNHNGLTTTNTNSANANTVNAVTDSSTSAPYINERRGSGASIYRCKQIRGSECRRPLHEVDCCCMSISCTSLAGGLGCCCCCCSNEDCTNTVFTSSRKKRGIPRSEKYNQGGEKVSKDVCKKRKGEHTKGFKSFNSSLLKEPGAWDGGNDGINTSNSKDSLQLLNHNSCNNISKKERRGRKKRFTFKRSTSTNEFKKCDLVGKVKNSSLIGNNHTLGDGYRDSPQVNNLNPNISSTQDASYVINHTMKYKDPIKTESYITYGAAPSTIHVGHTSLANHDHSFQSTSLDQMDDELVHGFPCYNNDQGIVETSPLSNTFHMNHGHFLTTNSCFCDPNPASLGQSLAHNIQSHHTRTTQGNCAMAGTLSTSFNEMLNMNIDLPQNCNSMNSILDQQDYQALISNDHPFAKNITFKMFSDLDPNSKNVLTEKTDAQHTRDFVCLNSMGRFNQYSLSTSDHNSQVPMVAKHVLHASEAANLEKRHNRHLSLTTKLSHINEAQHLSSASSHSSSSSSCAMPDVNSIPDSQIPPPPKTPASRVVDPPVLTYQNRVVPGSDSQESVFVSENQCFHASTPNQILNNHYSNRGMMHALNKNGIFTSRNSSFVEVSGNTIPLFSFGNNGNNQSNSLRGKWASKNCCDRPVGTKQIYTECVRQQVKTPGQDHSKGTTPTPSSDGGMGGNHVQPNAAHSKKFDSRGENSQAPSHGQCIVGEYKGIDTEVDHHKRGEVMFGNVYTDDKEKREMQVSSATESQEKSRASSHGMREVQV